MKKLEKILVFIMLIALVMKLYLMPGGSSISEISMVLLSLIYFPFGFAFLNQIPMRKIFSKDAYKEQTTIRLICAIGVGISLSAICIGILFKLNSWPGSNRYIIVGLLTLFIIQGVALFRKIKLKQKIYSFMVRRIAILSILGIIFLILPDLPIERIRFGNHPDYIKACEDYLNHPQDAVMKEKEQFEYIKATSSKEDFEMYLKYENRSKHQK